MRQTDYRRRSPTRPLRGLVVLGCAVAVAAIAPVASAAVPPNTSPPKLAGTFEQGNKVMASTGSWTGNPTSFGYQWQRCGSDTASCSDISSATAKTYTLTASDVDKHVRVVVTAANSDGRASASSSLSPVVSSNTEPRNASRPTISGTLVPAEELKADTGTWTGGVRSFAYQWQRCDADGANCTDVSGATGQTYGVRAADVGHTLRVAVTATNDAGSTTATSDRTALVPLVTTPTVTTTVTQTVAPPTPAVNHRPTIVILSVRFVGARTYVRFRACDDSRKNLTIVERDSKPGVAAYTRRFSTPTPPRPCGSYVRSWLPAPRFRHGRYTITLWARDRSGLTSKPAQRTFVR